MTKAPTPNWYERLGTRNRSLMQGDILRGCPIPLLPENLDIARLQKLPQDKREIKLELENYDVIVLSQSCDIVTDKLSSILLCPIWPIEQLPTLIFNPDKPDNRLIVDSKAYLNRCEAIRIGVEPRFHMLDVCEFQGLEHPFQLVDFWTVFNLPKPYLTKIASRPTARLRLNPPYVEHLSQAFARFFMRVGLPTTIPQFKK